MSEEQEILGREVPVQELEYELRHLWDADQVNTKASLINFAIYSEHPGALKRNTSLVAAITREHACRALLIGVTLDAEESSARAWITAHCHLVHGRKSVCSEQVAFQLNGKAIGRIRNVVFAHMESDLPLVLWWQGQFSRIFEPKLYTIIDRLIVDSSSWEQPAEQFHILCSALEAGHRRMVVHDLSWTRSNALRAALASVFDDVRWNTGLKRISRLRIGFAKGHRISALLIVAWLAETLHWEGARRGGRIAFTYADKAVDVDLYETTSESATLSRLELDAGDISVLLEREAGSRFLRCMVQRGAEMDSRLVPADEEKDAQLVSVQLARAGSNRIYKSVLSRLRSLI